MTVLINLIGAPGVGKTTTSADLFATLKYANKNVELVAEWVKKLAWDEKKLTEFDQYYIFGKETHNQSRLFGKVDYIISDSPIWLTCFYQWHYNKSNTLVKTAQEFYSLANKYNVKVVNFLLARNKEYNTKGRYQTEEQAISLDKDIKKFLEFYGVEFTHLTVGDRMRAPFILNTVDPLLLIGA